MSKGHVRLRRAGYAQGAFDASVIVPFTATLPENSVEGTPIGIVGLEGDYAGAITVTLVDSLGGRVKLGANNQLQAGSVPTDYADFTNLSPVIRVTAVSGGRVKQSTVAIEIIDSSAPPITGVYPSTFWNGTALAGFALGATIPTVPVETVDADITTTAPKMCPLRPDREHLTAAYKFFVRAEHFGGMGALSGVYCDFEGNSFLGDGPKVLTEPNPRGSGPDIKFIGYEWTVDRDAISGTGDLAAFFRAVPVNGAHQSRTIGPYTYYKYDYAYGDGLYDADIVVGTGLPTVAGLSYPTMAAALLYCRTAPTKKNPRITVTVTGAYTPAGSGNNGNTKGRAHFFCAPGVTATIALASPAALNIQYDGCHFHGAGFVYDLKNVTVVNHRGVGALHVFEGCTITNSDGPFPLINGNTYVQSQMNGAILIGNEISNLGIGRYGGPLVRNNNFVNCCEDLFTTVACAVSNTGHDMINYYYRRTDITAMTIAYIGAGTGTFAKVGSGQNSTSHIFRLSDAAGSVDFTLNGSYYTIVDLCAAISARLGWTAVAVAPPMGSPRRAAALTGFGSSRGGTWAAVTATATPQNIATAFELHSDWEQVAEKSSITSNRFICENVFYNCDQTLVRANGIWRGAVVANNAWFASLKSDYAADPTAYATTSNETWQSALKIGLHKSVSLYNNSMPNQGFNLEVATPADVYNENIANVWSDFQDGATSYVPDRNHNIAGAMVNGTNTTTGGSYSTLLTDARNGDFTPIGALLSNLAVPAVAFDAFCNTRAASDAKGAVRAA